MKHFQGVDKTLQTQERCCINIYRNEHNIQSALTRHINDIDTAAVCRPHNLHREDITFLTAHVIGGNTVVIAVLLHCATVQE